MLAAMATRHLPVLATPATWAAAVAAQVEIQLGHLCNNRCVFCVSGQRTAQGLARPLPTAPTLAALDEAAAAGARKVTFLGGEPTLQPSLVPAIERAIDLGFREIVLFTNGVKTARAGYVDDILALGAARGFHGFEWRFSIQGGDQAAHDDVTQKPGSFARLVAGMRHLQARGQRLTANACINEHSYRSLPGYVDLVREHGIRQLHLDQVRPRDAGQRSDAELRAMMPRYAAMVPYFRVMLDRFARELPGFDINVGNLPYCVMPERAAVIHHDGEATSTVAADGDQLSRPWDKYADKRRDKFHPPACTTCQFRPRCNGVFTKYAQFYGVDEFVPVPAPRPTLRPTPRPTPAPPTMKYRTLPGTASQLSAIGLRCRPGDHADTVAAALDLGIDWFTLDLTDTDLGATLLRALGTRRHEVTLLTTLDGRSPAQVTAAVESARRRLDLDVLPLVALEHGASPGCLDALLALRDAGKVAHIGLSPGTGPISPTLRAALPQLACLRVPYALHHRGFEAGLRDLCIGTGPTGQPAQRLGVIAYDPRMHPSAPHDPIQRALATVGARIQVATEALALAWLLRQPGVSVAEIDAPSPAALRTAVQALDLLTHPKLWAALQPHLDARCM